MSGELAAQVEILPLGHGDVDDMLAVEQGVTAFPWTRGNFLDSIAANYSVWGCRVAGELIGYSVVMMALDEAHLLNLSVAGKRQRMGFGARLLRHAMQSARRAGATIVLLEVRPSNDRALTLYRHFGFRQIGVRRDYYAAAGGREDALVLQHVFEEISA